jgi:SAM-dependent methyltransferase
MSHDTDRQEGLAWSGERYVPQIAGNIRLEHLHRYLLARDYCQGKRVLDIASGEGYGSALLAEVADRVIGVDLSVEAVAHARRCYVRPNLRFAVGDCAAIPLADGVVDVVVSFETIEHHAQHDAMLREIKRVLAVGGTLVISSPDKREYSDVPAYANPFHVRELYREDLETLLGTYFRHVAIGGQRIKAGSVIWSLGDDIAAAFKGFETSDDDHVRPLGPPLYLLAVASDQPIDPIAPGLFDGGAFVWFSDHLNAFQSAEAGYHEQLRLLNESTAAAKARADEQVARAEARAAALQADLQASATRVTALEADVAALSAENAGIRGALNQTTERLAETARHDRHLANEIAIMEASHSWRVTAPLRALRRTAGASSPRLLTVRQAVPVAYRALPLSIAARLKIKSALFRTLPFLFQRTSAYRTWDAYRRTAALPPAPIAEVSDGAVARLPAWYYDDAEHDYVPIAESTGVNSRIKAIAFYLPQFHPTAENDRWWGRGFTEWTNVSRGKPQFAGHYQPHLPGELGFYDLRVLDVQRRQIELAKIYGLHGFCYHHYWFSGTKLLRQPLDQLLANPDLDLPFCLCWANENWTRRWDGQESDILIGQQHSPEDDLAFIKDIEPALRDRRYIRVGGRPLLVVYRPALLPDAQATAARWRHYCRDAGIGEIYLVSTHAFDRIDPHALGFDAAMEFTPNNLGSPAAPDLVAALNPDFRGTVYDYRYLVEHSRAYQPNASYVLFRTVTPMWDNEARRPGRGSVFAHSTPARYQEMLENACRYTEDHLGPELPFVFINAWNEWAEGSHLEPDRRYGYAYLQATADALRQWPARVTAAERDSHEVTDHAPIIGSDPQASLDMPARSTRD